MRKLKIKTITALLFSLILLMGVAVPALASNTNEVRSPYIIDTANLLTSEELDTLETRAGKISNGYQCGVYVITVDDFSDVTYDDDVYEAAVSIYKEYDLGWEEDKSGVLLLLSMKERDYSLITYGYGNTAFTAYGKDVLSEEFLDDFGDDNWYEGFADYLANCGDLLKYARAGNPLDVEVNPLQGPVGVVISIVLGCFISIVICLVLKSNMKSVALKTKADAYVNAKSVKIRIKEDRFTHSTQTKVKIESKSSSGGSGSSSRSGGGFSGKSGKF